MNAFRIVCVSSKLIHCIRKPKKGKNEDEGDEAGM